MTSHNKNNKECHENTPCGSTGRGHKHCTCPKQEGHYHYDTICYSDPCDFPKTPKQESWSERFDEEFHRCSLPKCPDGIYEHKVKSFIAQELASQQEESNARFLKECENHVYEMKAQRQKDREKLEGMRKTGNNGEGLPHENSPEIYGNARIETYKKGFNDALCSAILKVYGEKI